MLNRTMYSSFFVVLALLFFLGFVLYANHQSKNGFQAYGTPTSPLRVNVVTEDTDLFKYEFYLHNTKVLSLGTYAIWPDTIDTAAERAEVLHAILAEFKLSSPRNVVGGPIRITLASYADVYDYLAEREADNE